MTNVDDYADEIDDLFDEYKNMISVLNQSVWENRVTRKTLNEWLDNFSDTKFYPNIEFQKINALFLLTQFMYFGTREIRTALRYLYNSLFKYPIIRELRKENKDTLDKEFLLNSYNLILEKTRFLPVGNPSESGSLMLYYFRQENKLQKDLFIAQHEAISTTRDGTTGEIIRFADNAISHYVFIDDFCGSGKQAENYSKNILEELKDLNPHCKAYYFVLFASKVAMSSIKKNTKFDDIKCVFELDDSFRCHTNASRYFVTADPPINRDFIIKMIHHYGDKFLYGPLGYKDGGYLLAFAHNTPDNTIPIFGGQPRDELSNWNKIFPRYEKNYKEVYHHVND